MSTLTGYCVRCERTSIPLAKEDTYCPYCHNEFSLQIVDPPKPPPSSAPCAPEPPRVFPHCCNYCKEGMYYEGLCKKCTREMEKEACAAWSKFLSDFNKMGTEGVIDISRLKDAQLVRAEALLRLERPNRRFEHVVVDSKFGKFTVLCYSP